MDKKYAYHTQVIITTLGQACAIVNYYDGGNEIQILNESYDNLDEAISMANWAIIQKEEEMGR